MDLSLYFEPITLEKLNIEKKIVSPMQLANNVLFYNPDAPLNITEVKLAIIGVPEARNSFQNAACDLAPDEIRCQFYQLYRWLPDVRIIDLGNLKVGKTIEDTYELMSDVLSYLIENKVVPIILGGGNDLAYANYRAYEKLEQVVNLVAVDPRFDLGDENTPIRSDAYLNKLVLQQPNYLLDYANIGFQSYMNSPLDVKMMDELYFESFRVGLMRQKMDEVEPIVRNADMVSIDIAAVRRPDAPGCPHASSNGFYGEEICQIAKYAGFSEKLSSFGIYEYNPTLDYSNQTSQLIGHILWYFVDGFVNRLQDGDFQDRHNFRQYTVDVTGTLSEMVFFYSRKSGRWWMQVPMRNPKTNVMQNYYLPCSKRDYDMACEDMVSDRWWKAYNKLNR